MVGSPVAFVSVALEGVPSAPPLTSRVDDEGIAVPLTLVAVAAPMFGVTRVGEFERTGKPVPVVVSKSSCPKLFEPKTKALAGTPAPFTLTVLVALIVPDPVAARLAPVPTTMAA